VSLDGNYLMDIAKGLGIKPVHLEPSAELMATHLLEWKARICNNARCVVDVVQLCAPTPEQRLECEVEDALDPLLCAIKVVPIPAPVKHIFFLLLQLGRTIYIQILFSF
jgi:hypothetical protein